MNGCFICGGPLNKRLECPKCNGRTYARGSFPSLSQQEVEEIWYAQRAGFNGFSWNADRNKQEREVLELARKFKKGLEK